MSSPIAEPVAALPGAFVALLPIAEPDASQLFPLERAIYDVLPTEHRKREWWAGRMAARAVLRACGAGAASILRDEKGAPRLEGPHADQVTVAITHGRTTAAAIAARLDGPHPYVGLDLVDAQDRARVEKIAPRFLKPSEAPLVAADPEALLLCWCAREAVAKATQTGMFLFALSQVWLEAIDPAENRLTVNVPGLELAFRRLPEGGFLVVCAASQAGRDSIHAGLAQATH